jgi:hypothetical protein
MKTKIIILMCLMVLSKKSFPSGCTNFTPAVISENTSGCVGNHIKTLADVHNTGNDARSPILNVSLPTMEVNVWDGVTPGLGWNDGTSMCSISLPAHTDDPDVTLVESYNSSINAITWYAIIVYRDNTNNNCICDLYYWNSTSFQRYTTGYPVTLSSGGYISAINVDANNLGDIGIVWDDSQTGYIEAVTGYGHSLTSPTLGSISVSLANSRNCISPDVSTRNDLVYFTFLDQNNKTMYVDYYSTSIIYSGSSLYRTSLLSNSSPGNYYFPRIACPPGTNSAEYSAVVEQAYNGSYDIVNFTNDGTTTYNNIYTDASQANGPCAINSAYNMKPVISYNDAYSGLMVGWSSDYYNGVTFYPRASVAVACDVTGAVNSCITDGINNSYLIVPKDNFSKLYQCWALSIAGRDYNNSSNMLYTYYMPDLTDVRYKDVPFCYNSGGVYSLRKKGGDASNNLSISPNPFTDELKITLGVDNANVRIYDLVGNLLLQTEGNEAKINEEFNRFSADIPKGIYYLIITNNDGVEGNKLKIIKM